MSHPPALAQPDRPVIALPPEIFHLITEHLTRVTDLSACSRVSKEWQVMFTPWLYMALDLRMFPWDEYCCKSLVTPVARMATQARYGLVGMPTPQTLVRYGHHIKYLAIDPSYEPSTVSTITSLRSLRMDRMTSRSHQIPPDQSRVLFANNPGLRSLDLHYFDLCNTLCSIARATPHLERLLLRDSHFSHSDLLGVLRVCQSLQCLVVHHCTVVDEAEDHLFPIEDTLALPIQEFKLVNCYGPGLRYLLELVQYCPRLMSTTLQCCSRLIAKSSIKVRLNHCHDLYKVAIMYLSNDLELAQILDSCLRPLQELSLNHCRFGEYTLDSVQRHLGSLTTLCLEGIYDTYINYWSSHRPYVTAERRLIEMAFRSCPKLVHLECPRLQSVSLFPKETENWHWDYELSEMKGTDSAPSGSIGLKTLKVGALDRTSWSGNDQVQTLAPFPEMEELEEVMFATIVLVDEYGRFLHLDNRFLPEGDFWLSQLENDRKLHWMKSVWPKLIHFIKGE